MREGGRVKMEERKSYEQNNTYSTIIHTQLYCYTVYHSTVLENSTSLGDQR